MGGLTRFILVSYTFSMLNLSRQVSLKMNMFSTFVRAFSGLQALVRGQETRNLTLHVVQR